MSDFGYFIFSLRSYFCCYFSYMFVFREIIWMNISTWPQNIAKYIYTQIRSSLFSSLTIVTRLVAINHRKCLEICGTWRLRLLQSHQYSPKSIVWYPFELEDIGKHLPVVNLKEIDHIRASYIEFPLGVKSIVVCGWSNTFCPVINSLQCLWTIEVQKGGESPMFRNLLRPFLRLLIVYYILRD